MLLINKLPAPLTAANRWTGSFDPSINEEFGERGGFTCVSSRSLLKVHLRYWEILKDGGEGTISRPQEERGSTI